MNLVKKPKHIGLIMDGNGRWATARQLNRSFGHKEGVSVAEKVVGYAIKNGIPYISLYALSTENMKRPKSEVDYLMQTVKKAFSQSKRFMDKDVRIVISGCHDGLKNHLIELIEKVMADTKNNKTITVNICFNYGGRREIIDAVNKIISSGVKEVSEESFYNYLYNGFLPDPDIIVRTGAYMRLSNFLTYESSYSELYFTSTLWPDFSENEFNKVLEYYSNAKRNFGKID